MVPIMCHPRPLQMEFRSLTCSNAPFVRNVLINVGLITFEKHLLALLESLGVKEQTVNIYDIYKLWTSKCRLGVTA